MNSTIHRYHDGATELYCLSDATATFPFPAPAIMPTVSAAEWAAAHHDYPASFAEGEKFVAQVTCYLLRQGGHTILIDTGMGEHATSPAGAGKEGQLLRQLAAIGVDLAAIDLVVHTHLHQDHVGWNLRLGVAGVELTFPNARYVAPQLDWQHYAALLTTKPEAAAHVAQQIVPLQERGRLTLVTGEVTLAEGLKAFPTPGHSPGHMSLLVDGATEHYLIAGDAFFHPLQLVAPTHHTAMDSWADAAQANATRTQLVAQIQQEGWLVSACHFFTPAFGRLVAAGETAYWQPVAAVMPQS